MRGVAVAVGVTVRVLVGVRVLVAGEVSAEGFALRVPLAGEVIAGA